MPEWQADCGHGLAAAAALRQTRRGYNGLDAEELGACCGLAASAVVPDAVWWQQHAPWSQLQPVFFFLAPLVSVAPHATTVAPTRTRKQLNFAHNDQSKQLIMN